MEIAPILLFVYNRPDHTKQTLDALAKNELASSSVLYVLADGPKEAISQSDLHAIHETRALFSKGTYGFRDLIFSASDVNLGLSESVIKGVDAVLAKHGKVIVLEDDIVTGAGFLTYMNNALSMYEHEEKVISISAYNFPIDPAGLPDTFFIRGADCWGWATWSRGWKFFEQDAKKLYSSLKEENLTTEFDLKGAYPYTQMLLDHINGKVNSWAIRWHASAFLANKLTLCPQVSLVRNIGLEGSGTHGESNNSFAASFTDHCDVKPGPVQQNKLALERIREFYAPSKFRSFIRSLKNKLHV